MSHSTLCLAAATTIGLAPGAVQFRRSCSRSMDLHASGLVRWLLPLGRLSDGQERVRERILALEQENHRAHAKGDCPVRSPSGLPTLRQITIG